MTVKIVKEQRELFVYLLYTNGTIESLCTQKTTKGTDKWLQTQKKTFTDLLL